MVIQNIVDYVKRVFLSRREKLDNSREYIQHINENTRKEKKSVKFEETSTIQRKELSDIFTVYCEKKFDVGYDYVLCKDKSRYLKDLCLLYTCWNNTNYDPDYDIRTSRYVNIRSVVWEIYHDKNCPRIIVVDKECLPKENDQEYFDRLVALFLAQQCEYRGKHVNNYNYDDENDDNL